MTDLVPIRRALISVSDKNDLIPFARGLVERGIEIISTGGTHRALTEAGLSPIAVDTLTGFPEMMDGRVKTLHPTVHGGILARRDLDSHVAAMEEHGIQPIDIVCVNLYPFEQTIRQDEVTNDEAIEQIDIGGPSMLRSAAKNHDFVTVVTDPSQYDRVIGELDGNDGCTTMELRRDLATAAFARTAEYDATIAAWMSGATSARFPSVLRLNFVGQQQLRYGENPHQDGAVYRDPDFQGPSVTSAKLISGKPLSYNNLLDAASALEIVQDLHDIDSGRFASAVIKHTNPCGAASADRLEEAWEHAFATDRQAPFGGIIVVNNTLDLGLAEKISEIFCEVIIAPGFTDDARAIFEKKKNFYLKNLVTKSPNIPRNYWILGLSTFFISFFVFVLQTRLSIYMSLCLPFSLYLYRYVAVPVEQCICRFL